MGYVQRSHKFQYSYKDVEHVKIEKLTLKISMVLGPTNMQIHETKNNGCRALCAIPCCAKTSAGTA